VPPKSDTVISFVGVASAFSAAMGRDLGPLPLHPDGEYRTSRDARTLGHAARGVCRGCEGDPIPILGRG
jgi:hypothetical protein